MDAVFTRVNILKYKRAEDKAKQWKAERGNVWTLTPTPTRPCYYRAQEVGTQTKPTWSVFSGGTPTCFSRSFLGNHRARLLVSSDLDHCLKERGEKVKGRKGGREVEN